MPAETPKPSERGEPRSRKLRVFDEVQAKFRSQPWHNGGRFGYIDLSPIVILDLYGPRHLAAEEEFFINLAKARRDALDEISQIVENFIDNPQI